MNTKHLAAFIVLLDITSITIYGILAVANYEKDSYMSVEEKMELSREQRGERTICYPVSHCMDNSTGVPYVITGYLNPRVCEYKDWEDTENCISIPHGVYIAFIIMAICLYSATYSAEYKTWFTQTGKMLILRGIIVILTMGIYWSIPGLKLNKIFMMIGLSSFRILTFGPLPLFVKILCPSFLSS